MHTHERSIIPLLLEALLPGQKSQQYLYGSMGVMKYYSNLRAAYRMLPKRKIPYEIAT